jgi:hypothetical protein
MRFLGFSNHEKGGRSEARNFEVMNGLQHVFEKWVELYKKCIACQGRYFGKIKTVTTPLQSSDIRLRKVHELFRRPTYYGLVANTKQEEGHGEDKYFVRIVD